VWVCKINKQRDKFKERMDSMGRKIDMAQKEFFELITVVGTSWKNSR